jgi:SET domain-containing protein
MDCYACFRDVQDYRLHEVALFASRDIAIGEELTYSYSGNQFDFDSPGVKVVPCHCDSKKCRGKLRFK